MQNTFNNAKQIPNQWLEHIYSFTFRNSAITLQGKATAEAIDFFTILGGKFIFTEQNFLECNLNFLFENCDVTITLCPPHK